MQFVMKKINEDACYNNHYPKNYNIPSCIPIHFSNLQRSQEQNLNTFGYEIFVRGALSRFFEHNNLCSG